MEGFSRDYHRPGRDLGIADIDLEETPLELIASEPYVSSPALREDLNQVGAKNLHQFLKEHGKPSPGFDCGAGAPAHAVVTLVPREPGRLRQSRRVLRQVWPRSTAPGRHRRRGQQKVRRQEDGHPMFDVHHRPGAAFATPSTA